MARPRNTTATQRRQNTAPPLQTAPELDPQRRATIVAMLVETGWVEDDFGRWSHEAKTSGNPLPLGEAFAFEERSRAAEHKGTGGGTFVSAPELEAVAAEAELAAATVTIEPDLTPEEFELVHDRIGRVMFWSCYQCKLQVRYSPDCHCEVCEKITEGVCCPRCGDNEPNLQRRR